AAAPVVPTALAHRIRRGRRLPGRIPHLDVLHQHAAGDARHLGGGGAVRPRGWLFAAGIRRLLPGHPAGTADDGRVGGLGNDHGDPPGHPGASPAAADPSAAAVVRRQPGGDPHARRGGDPCGGDPAVRRALGAVARLVLLAPALPGVAGSLAALLPGAVDHRDVRAAESAASLFDAWLGFSNILSGYLVP